MCTHKARVFMHSTIIHTTENNFNYWWSHQNWMWLAMMLWMKPLEHIPYSNIGHETRRGRMSDNKKTVYIFGVYILFMYVGHFWGQRPANRVSCIVWLWQHLNATMLIKCKFRNNWNFMELYWLWSHLFTLVSNLFIWMSCKVFWIDFLFFDISIVFN